jgi:hypothetical protein
MAGIPRSVPGRGLGRFEEIEGLGATAALVN